MTICEANTTRAIPGYPGYEITSDGRVYSKRFPGRELKNQQLNGYLRVTLSRNRNAKQYGVHVLVALTFIGPKPDRATCVRHLNDDRRDNRAENLAYGTSQDNTDDMLRNGHHWNGRKTACQNGHPLDETNTYSYAGQRHCRTCRRLRNRNAQAAMPKKGQPAPHFDRSGLCRAGLHDVTQPGSMLTSNGVRRCAECRRKNQITQNERRRGMHTRTPKPLTKETRHD